MMNKLEKVVRRLTAFITAVVDPASAMTPHEVKQMPLAIVIIMLALSLVVIALGVIALAAIL